MKMLKTQEYKGLKWVDLENPTREEIREVMDTYHINPIVGEELLTPTLKPKVDLYPEYIYLVLHFPAFKHTHSSKNEQEIDFVIGKKFLITTHYETVDPLLEFSKVFEVNSILDRGEMTTHAGYIFYFMIKSLYKALGHELDYVNDQLLTIEGRIFAGNEKAMVGELSKISRELLHFKKALNPHRDILESFALASGKIYGNEFSYHAQDISGAYFRTSESIVANIEFLNELRATNDSLLSTKQNETMRVLAIVSFILLPMTLITSLFGISSNYVPFLSNQNGFYLVLIFIALSGIFVFLFFKWRKWL
jgi:magnesium transporter